MHALSVCGECRAGGAGGVGSRRERVVSGAGGSGSCPEPAEPIVSGAGEGSRVRSPRERATSCSPMYTKLSLGRKTRQQLGGAGIGSAFGDAAGPSDG